MKQRITPEQLNKLTEKQKKKLNLLCNKFIENHSIGWDFNGWVYPNIGQMIELLSKKLFFHISNMYVHTEISEDGHLDKTFTNPQSGWGLFSYQKMDIRADELCDALWAAVVKEVL